MAAAANTLSPTRVERRFKFTRTTIYAFFFIILGLSLRVGGDLSTRFTFGEGLPAITLPAAPTVTIFALWFIGSGVINLIPTVPKRIKSILLFISTLLIIPAILTVAAAGGSTNVTVMLQVSLRLSTPIVLGALAGIWSERSGVANIGIEGMMLTGACFGFVAYTLLLRTGMIAAHGQALGVLVAVLSGALMAMLHAWLSITFKTDQIVSGTVINILALGLTSFIRREVLVSSEAGRGTMGSLNDIFPQLEQIPILGDVFFSGKPIFYAMFVLLILTQIILFYTRWGLRTRAVGENPKAADTLGINVIRNRWINVIISGLIAGLAGAWFSLETTGSFDDNMTSGRGFIALAAMIFGKWMPFGAFGGGLLFGFSDALGQRFQLLGVAIPPQFLQMVPYVVTIIVLAGLVGRAIAPKADGVPYDKEGK